MKHYHGTPVGGTRSGTVSFLAGRLALVPWLRHEDLPVCLEVCRGVILDNSAFTAWRSGEPITDWSGYYAWVESVCRHPRFDWAIIPDAIDGTEEENDRLIEEWRATGLLGVPVWHYHESLERLDWLVGSFPTVCLGSSGEWPTPGLPSWWMRTAEVMKTACNADGEPRCKLHGLRMLAPDVFTRMPLASADSSNAAQNGNRNGNAVGLASSWQGSCLTAWRIEQHQSAARWEGNGVQQSLFDLRTA